MAYNEDLAGRVRAVLPPAEAVTERQMFGGLAFMLGGHMFCGVVGDTLMVRLGPEGADRALNLNASDLRGFGWWPGASRGLRFWLRCVIPVWGHAGGRAVGSGAAAGSAGRRSVSGGGQVVRAWRWFRRRLRRRR